MDVTRPCKIRGFGDIHGPKPYKFIWFEFAFTSETPALPNVRLVGAVNIEAAFATDAVHGAIRATREGRAEAELASPGIADAWAAIQI